jgi:lactosylceramide 4-alpha-galactosyltransferase
MSDVLRIATVYKNGGIYLDLDCLVIKSLSSLKNAVGFEDVSHTMLANGVLIFDRHHPFLADAMEEVLHT